MVGENGQHCFRGFIHQMNYYRFFYWLRHEFKPIGHIKWFVQRGVRGYSDRDLWSLDYYLSSVLSKSLIQLADTTHGHPCRATEERSDGAGLNCEGCKCAELWDTELRENADKFRLMHEDDWDSTDSLNQLEQSNKEAWLWLSIWAGALWD